MIATMFDTTAARLGLNRGGRDADGYDGDSGGADDDDEDAPTTFRRPPPRTGQLSLF